MVCGFGLMFPAAYVWCNGACCSWRNADWPHSSPKLFSNDSISSDKHQKGLNDTVCPYVRPASPPIPTASDRHPPYFASPHTSGSRKRNDTMGWFSSSDDSGPKKTSGGAFEAPTRTTRAKCYEARDAFFECLDRNNILDSINTKDGRAAASKACGEADQVFEKNCAHSWVRRPLPELCSDGASARVRINRHGG